MLNLSERCNPALLPCFLLVGSQWTRFIKRKLDATRGNGNEKKVQLLYTKCLVLTGDEYTSA